MDGRDERIFIVAYENANNVPEFNQHETYIRELGREIMDTLGSDCLLFLEYEKLIYLAEGYLLEGAYNLGLQDANQNANQRFCTQIK